MACSAIVRTGIGEREACFEYLDMFERIVAANGEAGGDSAAGDSVSPPISLLVSDNRPLFAYLFNDDSVSELPSFDDIDEARAGAGFVWVHLDVDNPAAMAWLNALPVPHDILEAVAEPTQRGRLFGTDTVIYGHLRDFRECPDGSELRGGALCVLMIDGLAVTGRRLPLRAVGRLRQRVADGTETLSSPFDLLTAFFSTLNDLAEKVLEVQSERLDDIRADLLRHEGNRHRETLLEMRRQAMLVERDMSYKHAALRDLMLERPKMASPDEFRPFRREVERYASVVEDAQDLAEHCQFLLDELRAQVAEASNRNLYVLSVVSTVVLPATLITGLWGINVEGLPFTHTHYGFWEVTLLIAGAIGIGLGLMRLLRFL